MPDRIVISHTENSEKLSDTLVDDLLSALPFAQLHHIRRFKRYQDRQASLLARLLIFHHFLQRENAENGVRDLLFFNANGRPCLQLPAVDCSISHSNESVVTCIGYGYTVGIDIEKIKTTNFQGMASSVPALYTFVRDCTSGEEQFFNAWTMLESLLKAEGSGFTSDFSIRSLSGNRYSAGSSTWTIEKITIRPDYACHLAYSAPEKTIPVVEKTCIGLQELIEAGRQLKSDACRPPP